MEGTIFTNLSWRKDTASRRKSENLLWRGRLPNFFIRSGLNMRLSFVIITTLRSERSRRMLKVLLFCFQLSLMNLGSPIYKVRVRAKSHFDNYLILIIAPTILQETKDAEVRDCVERLYLKYGNKIDATVYWKDRSSYYRHFIHCTWRKKWDMIHSIKEDTGQKFSKVFNIASRHFYWGNDTESDMAQYDEFISNRRAILATARAFQMVKDR